MLHIERHAIAAAKSLSLCLSLSRAQIIRTQHTSLLSSTYLHMRCGFNGGNESLGAEREAESEEIERQSGRERDRDKDKKRGFVDTVYAVIATKELKCQSNISLYISQIRMHRPFENMVWNPSSSSQFE